MIDFRSSFVIPDQLRIRWLCRNLQDWPLSILYSSSYAYLKECKYLHSYKTEIFSAKENKKENAWPILFERQGICQKVAESEIWISTKFDNPLIQES